METKRTTLTMGQAVDRVLDTHMHTYPESEVISVHAEAPPDLSMSWLVEVRAEHFSRPLRYLVSHANGRVTQI